MAKWLLQTWHQVTWSSRVNSEKLKYRASAKLQKLLKSSGWGHLYGQSCLCEAPPHPCDLRQHWVIGFTAQSWHFDSTEDDLWDRAPVRVAQWTSAQLVLMYPQATFGLLWNISNQIRFYLLAQNQNLHIYTSNPWGRLGNPAKDPSHRISCPNLSSRYQARPQRKLPWWPRRTCRMIKHKHSGKSKVSARIWTFRGAEMESESE